MGPTSAHGAQQLIFVVSWDSLSLSPHHTTAASPPPTPLLYWPSMPPPPQLMPARSAPSVAWAPPARTAPSCLPPRWAPSPSGTLQLGACRWWSCPALVWALPAACIAALIRCTNSSATPSPPSFLPTSAVRLAPAAWPSAASSACQRAPPPVRLTPTATSARATSAPPTLGTVSFARSGESLSLSDDTGAHSVSPSHDCRQPGQREHRQQQRWQRVSAP